MLTTIYVRFLLFYIFGALFLWTILNSITRKFRFRQKAAPDEKQAAPDSVSAVIISAFIGVAFALPFIPAHPEPNVGNWTAMLTRISILMGAYGILSLVCWIRMATRPTLLALYLAINAMIMCGLSFCLLMFIGAASPS